MEYFYLWWNIMLYVVLTFYLLFKGFLLSSTQQMVDRLVVQTQETIKNLPQDSLETNNEINIATGLIQDADNSKQVF